MDQDIKPGHRVDVVMSSGDVLCSGILVGFHSGYGIVWRESATDTPLSNYRIDQIFLKDTVVKTPVPKSFGKQLVNAIYGKRNPGEEREQSWQVVTSMIAPSVVALEGEWNKDFLPGDLVVFNTGRGIYEGLYVVGFRGWAMVKYMNGGMESIEISKIRLVSDLPEFKTMNKLVDVVEQYSRNGLQKPEQYLLKIKQIVKDGK